MDARRHPRKLAPPIWITLAVLSQDIIFFADTSVSLSLGAFLAVGVLSLGLLMAFLLSIITDPGHIPDDWEYVAETSSHHQIPALQECRQRKQDGSFRRCKWCKKFKPDRTHHCRVCRKCVLKMDHHSPWIMNCVGNRNHRWFLLSIMLYSALSVTLIITWQASGQLSRLSKYSLLWGSVVLWKYSEVCLFAVLFTGFSIFHLFLLTQNLTTIEFCEKRMKMSDSSATITHPNRGFLANLCDLCFPDDGLRVRQRPPFQILEIVTIDGQTVASFKDISPDDLVLVCKQRLVSIIGVSCKRQRLIMNERVLASSCSFWYQGAHCSRLVLTLVKLPEMLENGEQLAEDAAMTSGVYFAEATADADPKAKYACNPFQNKHFVALVSTTWVLGMVAAMWHSVSATTAQWLAAFLLFALLTIMMIPTVLTVAKKRPPKGSREPLIQP